MKAIEALHKANIQAIADVVLNHKVGGDEKELVAAVGVKEEDRREQTGEPEMVETHSRFTFPGRKGKYSDYVWDKHSFTGFCDDGNIKLMLHQYTNGQWEEMLEVEENGNYDYLLGMDIEYRNPQVREELKNWGIWYTETTGVDGFRLDALKHISPDFFPEWLDNLKSHFKKDFFIIGEYWKAYVQPLQHFIQFTEGRINLFDVPLHYHFHEASIKKEKYDMRNILKDTLVQSMPGKAITFVENHDTQPLQALESFVEIWFKPLAGAIVLLRQEGVPCVSYPSFYGAEYKDLKDEVEIEIRLDKIEILPLMLKIRRDMAYGKQQDYFDHEHVVGWTREGIPEMPNSGLAVLMSNAEKGEKWMSVGEINAGRKMVEIIKGQSTPVVLNEKGEGLFEVDEETIAIYVDEKYALKK